VHPNDPLRLSAFGSILPRPKYTKAELIGGSPGQGVKIVGGRWADADEDSRAVDEGAREGGSVLSGWCQAACQLILKFGDAAKVEDVMSSLTSGVSLRATDAKQRHGDVFRY
jgi:hypothetical protein